MPCRDDYPSPPPLDPLLCEALDIIDRAGLWAQCSPDLAAWAKRHEEHEQSRVRNEALAKLTPKERRALGLK